MKMSHFAFRFQESYYILATYSNILSEQQYQNFFFLEILQLWCIFFLTKILDMS